MVRALSKESLEPECLLKASVQMRSIKLCALQKRFLSDLAAILQRKNVVLDDYGRAKKRNAKQVALMKLLGFG